MKTLTKLRKIFPWTFVLIAYMSLTSCPSTKDETTPEEEHCTSDIRDQDAFIKNIYNRTYFSFIEGDYIKLRYSSFDISNVCTSKTIYITGSAELSQAQTAPIQVILKLWWGPLEVNSLEIPLDKALNEHNNYVFEPANNSYTWDLSGYFPSGSDATIHLSIDFKFVSSGDNITDQDYLKSVFQGWSFLIYTYPYANYGV